MGDGAVRFREQLERAGAASRRTAPRSTASARSRSAGSGAAGDVTRPGPARAGLPPRARRRAPPQPDRPAHRRHRGPPPHVRRPPAGRRDRAPRVHDPVVAGDVRARAVQAERRVPGRGGRRRAGRLPRLLPLRPRLAHHERVRGPRPAPPRDRHAMLQRCSSASATPRRSSRSRCAAPTAAPTSSTRGSIPRRVRRRHQQRDQHPVHLRRANGEAGCGGETCRDRVPAAGIDRASYNTAENAADLADLRVAWASTSGTSTAPRTARSWRWSSCAITGGHPQHDHRLAVAAEHQHRRGVVVGTGQFVQSHLRRVRAQPACATAYPNLEADFVATVQRLDATPVVVETTDASGRRRR